MLYAEKDAHGAIIAIRKAEETETTAQDELTVAELTEFLSGPGERSHLEEVLKLTDSGVIRLIDDLVDLLEKKHIILLTDLPEEARKKLYQRRMVRQKLQEQPLIVDDIL
jgi:hypothetical protein